MLQTTASHIDDFAAFETDCFRDSGFYGADDCPSDWAIGSDEAGDRIYCEAVISDFLRCDVH